MAVLDEAHPAASEGTGRVDGSRATPGILPRRFDAPALDPADTRLRALVSDVEKKAVP